MEPNNEKLQHYHIEAVVNMLARVFSLKNQLSHKFIKGTMARSLMEMLTSLGLKALISGFFLLSYDYY